MSISKSVFKHRKTAFHGLKSGATDFCSCIITVVFVRESSQVDGGLRCTEYETDRAIDTISGTVKLRPVRVIGFASSADTMASKRRHTPRTTSVWLVIVSRKGGGRASG